MADTEPSAAANCVERLKTYVRTRKGTILAVEIILSFIMLFCYAASHYGGYSAVPICGLIFAIIFFVVFMMELDKQLLVINWLWTDCGRAGIGALLYIITALFCVAGGSGDGARIAGGVFGLIAGLLFAYDAYLSFMDIKNTGGRSAASTDDRV
ncbi:proteolipid protein 2b [Brachyhypopomus gauderio]|uniref:proteolipid protein 2b n=1 Tax=Brachyhypopomus gauderio TaxID=698409 RepID=UPI004042484D